MSFCSGYGLMNIAATCTTFRDFIAEDEKLMSKLRLRISCIGGIDEAKQRINSRRFTSVKIIHECHDASCSFAADLVSMTDDFVNIQDLTLWQFVLTPNEFGQIVGIFSPHMKTCQLCGLMLTKGSPNIQPVQCDNLVELRIMECDVKLFTAFSNSHTLKMLEIGSLFNPEDFIIKAHRFWELANIKLEKLVVEGLLNDSYQNRAFNDFMKKQTTLKEVSILIGTGNLSQIYQNLQQLPKLERIILGIQEGSMNLSVIPQGLLTKVGLLAQSLDNFEPPRSWFEYGLTYMLDATNNINVFERDFLAFLDNDTDIPGVKNCQLISYITIGTHLNHVFTKQFFRDLIEKLPILGGLKLVNNQPVQYLIDAVTESGKNWLKIEVETRAWSIKGTVETLPQIVQALQGCQLSAI
jgi:hypothetical protein